jgi:hypothetical protein
MRSYWLDSVGSGCYPVCDPVNMKSMRTGNFLDQLREHKLFKKDSPPWSLFVCLFVNYMQVPV